MIKTYEVWLEGYDIKIDSAPAEYLGSTIAENFQQACEIVLKRRDMMEHFDSEKLIYVGCKLFDNEIDARRSFG